jgi:hypothetical protein
VQSAFWGGGQSGGQKRLTRPITQYPRYERQVENMLELERAKILCARGPSPISSVKLTATVRLRGIVRFAMVSGRKTKNSKGLTPTFPLRWPPPLKYASTSPTVGGGSSGVVETESAAHPRATEPLVSDVRRAKSLGGGGRST